MPLCGVSGPFLALSWQAFGRKKPSKNISKTRMKPKMEPKMGSTWDQNEIKMGGQNGKVWPKKVAKRGQEENMSPRGSEACPESPQDSPKSAPRGPKRAPREPKESPKRAQESPSRPKRDPTGPQESL